MGRYTDGEAYCLSTWRTPDGSGEWHLYVRWIVGDGWTWWIGMSEHIHWTRNQYGKLKGVRKKDVGKAQQEAMRAALKTLERQAKQQEASARERLREAERLRKLAWAVEEGQYNVFEKLALAAGEET